MSRSDDDAVHVGLLQFIDCSVSEKITFFDLDMAVGVLQFYAQIFEKQDAMVIDYVKKHLVYLVAALQRIADSLRTHNQLYMLMYKEAVTATGEADKDIVNHISLFYQYLALVAADYGFEITVSLVSSNTP